MKKNRIDELLAKVNDLTKDEKNEIKAAVKEAGLNVSFRSNCKNCYSDALVLLSAEGRKAERGEMRKPESGKKQHTVMDEPFDNIELTKMKVAPVMRVYKNGSWMLVDETTEEGMAHLRMLWEGGHQRTVMLFYKVAKKTETATENETGKEADNDKA